jgi:Uma2 family endonuclease
MAVLEPIILPKPTHRRLVLPYKLDDRMALSPEIRAKATFEEFIELSLAAEYKVEYLNSYVISIFDYDKINDTMSTASITHENIVANMISLFFNLFRTYPDIRVLGSNTPVFIEEGAGVCNPDVTVVVGTPQTRSYKWRKRTKTVLLNPHIVVEVLSQGTRQYDLNEKLENYQKVGSIQQVVFVEQYWTEVISYSRTTGNDWQKIELKEKTQSLPIGQMELPLEDIYTKITF